MNRFVAFLGFVTWCGSVLGFSDLTVQSLLPVGLADRQVSAMHVAGQGASVVRIDHGQEPAGMAQVPFSRLDGGALQVFRQGFEDVAFLAHEHRFNRVPVMLAVADAIANWRLQPTTAGQGRAWPIKDASLIHHVVGGQGRYTVAGVSMAGQPLLVGVEPRTGSVTANLLADAPEGEVSQLLGLPSGGLLAVVNYRDRKAELIELDAVGNIARRWPAPGGALSVGVSSRGEVLLAYRENRRFSAMQIDPQWQTAWTRFLFDIEGTASRTLKLMAVDKGWMVAGANKGVIFVQRLGEDGRIEEPLADRSGLLPPRDDNWHAIRQDGQVLLRGVSRRPADLETGATTEFLLRVR